MTATTIGTVGLKPSESENGLIVRALALAGQGKAAGTIATYEWAARLLVRSARAQGIEFGQLLRTTESSTLRAMAEARAPGEMRIGTPIFTALRQAALDQADVTVDVCNRGITGSEVTRSKRFSLSSAFRFCTGFRLGRSR